MELNTVELLRALAIIGQVAVNGLKSIFSSGSVAVAVGIVRLAIHPVVADEDQTHRDEYRPSPLNQRTQQRAKKNRNESARLD